ncbi:MAG: GNAT family N-acetyltransferase [Caldimonas sp.]
MQIDVVRGSARIRPQPREAATSRTAPLRLEATWADSVDELRSVQRLRHRVFAGEMGARLSPVAGTPPGHDADRFDDFCAHLLVRAVFHEEERNEVVGTYRVLTPEAARRAGGFYSETEFDLGRLAPMRSRMAELGRSCIDPAWRTGGTILALWSALGEFMVEHGLDVAFGCASVATGDGGHAAASLWRQLSALHLAPPERRVRPLHPLAIETLRNDLNVETPALIRGYLRCGAELLGPPAWDPDFNSADLPMLMSLDGLQRRHRRHFLGQDDNWR